MSTEWFVARRLRSIEHAADSNAVDLLVDAVRATARPDQIPPVLVTAEDPAAQMTRSNTPNRPPLADRPAFATRVLRVRLTFVGSDAVRVQVTPADRSQPLQRDFGILVSEPTALTPWISDDTVVPTAAPAQAPRPASIASASAEVQQHSIGGPGADLMPGPADTSSEVQRHVIGAQGANLRVLVTPHPFDLQIRSADGTTLLRLALDDLDVHGLLHVPPLALADGRATLGVALAHDEHLFGLGERFDGLDHRGHRHRLWNVDARATTTAASYKNVPLVLSSRGYALFLHTPAAVDADLGATALSTASLTLDEGTLDLFVLGGGSLKRLLGAYTQLTGRAPRVPRWALGVWMSRCRYQSQAEVESVAERLRAEHIPCDVLHIDPAWLARPNLNCDFVINETDFPDFAGMLRRLRQQHFRVSVWELPYVVQGSPMYAEGVQRGYFAAETDGRVEGIVPADGLPRGVVDFTNPEAARWWQAQHRQLLDAGVAAFKTDFGEGLPAEARMANGMCGAEAHNLLPLLYNRAVFEATGQARSGQPVMVWGRSGWAGSQRFPAQWSGDPQTSADAMAACLRGGLSYALSAPGWWSVDIGGFYGPPPSPALYIRWTQFGMLCPLARAHGTTPREPWEFGSEATDVFRSFAQLRYRLTPYLERCGDAATLEGLPVLRPLVLEFEQDPVARTIEDQYLLGPDLLVAPVFSDSESPTDRQVYLPDGADWIDFWTGQTVRGGQFITQRVPLAQVPLFIRAGTDLGLLPEDPSREWIDTP